MLVQQTMFAPVRVSAGPIGTPGESVLIAALYVYVAEATFEFATDDPAEVRALADQLVRAAETLRAIVDKE